MKNLFSCWLEQRVDERGLAGIELAGDDEQEQLIDPAEDVAQPPRVFGVSARDGQSMQALEQLFL
jgi:hypothetical protein